jgi:hypothetical protein
MTDLRFDVSERILPFPIDERGRFRKGGSRADGCQTEMQAIPNLAFARVTSCALGDGSCAQPSGQG